MKETFTLKIESKDGIDFEELWGLIMDQYPENAIMLLKDDQMIWATIFGYLWFKGYFRKDCVGLRIWIWSAKQWWNQWLLIPYHCVMGVHYGYSWDSILKFCRMVVKE